MSKSMTVDYYKAAFNDKLASGLYAQIGVRFLKDHEMKGFFDPDRTIAYIRLTDSITVCGTPSELIDWAMKIAVTATELGGSDAYA